MHAPDREPIERMRFLVDRIQSMFNLKGEALRKMESDVLLAFQAAEERGEKRGRLIERALANLTPEEREALQCPACSAESK